MGKKGKNDNQAPKSKEPSQGTAGIAEMGKAFLLSDRWKKIQAHCLKSDDPTIVEAIKEGEIELHGIFEFISAKIDRLMRKQIKFKKAINKKSKLWKWQWQMRLQTDLSLNANLLKPL